MESCNIKGLNPQKPCSESDFVHRNKSLQEIIDATKNNIYSPPLNEIKVWDVVTKQEYTLAEIDRMLND